MQSNIEINDADCKAMGAKIEEQENSYKRSFTNRMLKNNWFDWYDIAKSFRIFDPMIAHAHKKLTDAGNRNGGKGMVQDVKEARASLDEWLKENE